MWRLCLIAIFSVVVGPVFGQTNTRSGALTLITDTGATPGIRITVTPGYSDAYSGFHFGQMYGAQSGQLSYRFLFAPYSQATIWSANQRPAGNYTIVGSPSHGSPSLSFTWTGSSFTNVATNAPGQTNFPTPTPTPSPTPTPVPTVEHCFEANASFDGTYAGMKVQLVREAYTMTVNGVSVQVPEAVASETVVGEDGAFLSAEVCVNVRQGDPVPNIKFAVRAFRPGIDDNNPETPPTWGPPINLPTDTTTGDGGSPPSSSVPPGYPPNYTVTNSPPSGTPYYPGQSPPTWYPFPYIPGEGGTNDPTNSPTGPNAPRPPYWWGSPGMPGGFPDGQGPTSVNVPVTYSVAPDGTVNFTYEMPYGSGAPPPGTTWTNGNTTFTMNDNGNVTVTGGYPGGGNVTPGSTWTNNASMNYNPTNGTTTFNGPALPQFVTVTPGPEFGGGVVYVVNQTGGVIGQAPIPAGGGPVSFPVTLLPGETGQVVYVPVTVSDGVPMPGAPVVAGPVQITPGWGPGGANTIVPPQAPSVPRPVTVDTSSLNNGGSVVIQDSGGNVVQSVIVQPGQTSVTMNFVPVPGQTYTVAMAPFVTNQENVPTLGPYQPVGQPITTTGPSGSPITANPSPTPAPTPQPTPTPFVPPTMPTNNTPTQPPIEGGGGGGTTNSEQVELPPEDGEPEVDDGEEALLDKAEGVLETWNQIGELLQQLDESLGELVAHFDGLQNVNPGMPSGGCSIQMGRARLDFGGFSHYRAATAAFAWMLGAFALWMMVKSSFR